MKNFLSVLFVVLSTIIFSQDREIVFETKLTFDQLVEKAKNENKLIFIDAYTTWCGPCKWMAKNIFTLNEVADYYNSNFINAKFDMEKGEGIELAKKFQVFCFPNLLFVDGNGDLVHRTAGAAQQKEDYIKLGETAKNEETRFSSLQKKYETNKNDSQFLASFIDAIASTCLPYDEYLSAYFSLQKDEDLISELNWDMMLKHLNSKDNREFNYILSNINKFEETYGKEEVHSKIKDILISAAQPIVFGKDYTKEKLASYKKEVEALNFESKGKVIFTINMYEFERNEDFNAMFDYALKEGDKYLELENYNSISWSIFEKSDNKKHLNKAVEWMEKLTSSESGKTWENLDTYASVLYKLRNKSLAKQVALEAVEIAKRAGISKEDYKTTEDLIAKIDKLK
jgi:thiol-disulfide isomerase/thioredoxin